MAQSQWGNKPSVVNDDDFFDGEDTLSFKK